jgi:hypothetical protein
MAGGITNCPDWQRYVLVHCSTDKVILINPRRVDWNVAQDPTAQIDWEYRHIRLADKVYFWFPKEGQCMISLFELGEALGAERDVRIGVEPGYCRELDIVEQVKRMAPWLKIHTTLHEVYKGLI